jgi:hypothetical protein
VVGNTALLEIDSGGQALIVSGQPNITFPGSGLTTVVVSGVAPTIVVVASGPIPSGTVISWPLEDKAIRTVLGGYVQGFDVTYNTDLPAVDWAATRPDSTHLEINATVAQGNVAVNSSAVMVTIPGGFNPVAVVASGTTVIATFVDDISGETDVDWPDPGTTAIYVSGSRPAAALKPIS